MPDFLTPAERSALMSRVRGTNTLPERQLFRALRRSGVYFARHARKLPGKPDVVFRRCRLAVFVDGDFWHGRGFDRWGTKLAPFWQAKIERNMARDRETEIRLRSTGWTVLRVWGKEAQRDPDACARRILTERERLTERRKAGTA
jgi:DNA mismatch endonuclease (patch repair protein)